MRINDDDFFDEKRDWSKVKDEILGSYLPPYLSKTRKLGKKIIIIDAFAGTGKFKDGSAGSPLLISQLSKKFAPSQYKIILINRKPKHHKELTKLLNPAITENRVETILGDSKDLLQAFQATLNDETLLLYLDPFGLKGCDFNTILPYLKRDSTQSSTELIMNVSAPIIHRLACKKAPITSTSKFVVSHRQILSKCLGGTFWQNHLLDSNLSATEQLINLMNEYKQRLKQYLPYSDYCPVYESHEKSTLKYFIFFASRHPDSSILMNDIMFSAFWKHIWKSKTLGTLFESDLVDDSILPNDYYFSLREEITRNLSISELSRKDLWCKIVLSNFMRFKESDFKKSVYELYKNGKIKFLDTRGTGRINDDSILSLHQ